MNRRRLLQSILLLAGLVGIAVVVAQTFDAADEQVLPSAEALVAAGAFSIIAIVSSARAWVALFSDLVESRTNHLIMRGTFYLAQLTKYLPAGGIVQTASQVGLAPSAGVPIRRAAVAFPVSVVGAFVACGTLGSGLVFDSELQTWTRVLALLGLGTVVFLHRGLMAWVIDLAHRFVSRIPGSDQLPTQGDILAFYAWALVTVGSLCAAYAILLSSLDSDVNPFFVFCAFALSWLVGFLAVPIPAGVGVREAVLVALLPGVGTAPLLAASLAARLLSIGAELLAAGLNRVAIRRHGRAMSRLEEVPGDPATGEPASP
jgi:uncharacterized membrane protein YbhN (UPF0104 family)